MEKFRNKLMLSSILLLGLPLATGPAVYAAKAIDLSKQKVSFLQALMTNGVKGATSPGFAELRRSVDLNKTLHVRVQQMYAGYPVVGGDAVLHIPQGAALSTKHLNSLVMSAKRPDVTMNGKMYEKIDTDLAKTSPAALTPAQADKAFAQVVSVYQRDTGNLSAATNKSVKRIVFIDDANMAHWAYQVSFDMAPIKDGALPAKPVRIVDAETLTVLAQWDNIKSAHQDDGDDVIYGGGYGGNIKMGKLKYDGLEGDLHYAKFPITRDADDNMCFMKNKDVTVKDSRTRNVMSYRCDSVNGDHNGVYWNADIDAVNDGYSPMNDALFGGQVIKSMYQDWYGIPVLTREDGEPMMLNMVVHARMDNAYWDGSQMTFGDGISMFYPLTSLGVGAHEISHGFTEQHSDLAYYGQSGGMNEAFSDMAAQAAEFYAYNGKNSWQIGPEIFKQKDRALRYMDQPSKDCHGKPPGSWCSIDNVDQYYSGLDVHFSSGIYNRAYYLMGTAEGWNARKAFDVMVKANQDYWTSRSTWVDGACGVLRAAEDLKYDLAPVKAAFKTVGVDISSCGKDSGSALA